MVKKAILNLQALLGVPVISDLAKHYSILEISCDGSPEHEKAGLSKEKVLIRAYHKRN